MKSTRLTKFSCVGLIVLCFLFATSAPYSADDGERLLGNFKSFKPEKDLLPSDVAVADSFVVGEGEPIGTVQKVVGTAYVIHKGEKVAYRLQDNNPLSTEDTLITMERSRLNAVMNDKSLFAMAPQAKLVLVKSLYDPEKDKRSSVMELLWGSVRFIVKKIAGEPDFVVQTPTAVAGVRGTDFAVSVSPSEYVSAIDRAVSAIGFVRPAYAQDTASLVTTVLTGENSTVGLAAQGGGTTLIGSTSVAAAYLGEKGIVVFFVGEAAIRTLNSIFSDLAILSMPPWME